VSENIASENETLHCLSLVAYVVYIQWFCQLLQFSERWREDDVAIETNNIAFMTAQNSKPWWEAVVSEDTWFRNKGHFKVVVGPGKIMIVWLPHFLYLKECLTSLYQYIYLR
jgi:hypothetical protein